MLALKTNGISSTTPTGTLTIGHSRYCQGPCMVATSESDEWTDDDDGALHPLSAAEHSVNLFNEGISG